jgi:uncharacterized damage-inducible protein DinB
MNPMTKVRGELAESFLEQARHSLRQHHLPRIVRCLEALSEEEIWWRPNQASNSVGNLVLHLEGNVRQWIVAGLGGEPERRDRPREFAERGPIPRRQLLAGLRATVRKATRVLRQISARDLKRPYTIQRLRVSGLVAIQHVVEHFAYHGGQIIYITKQRQSKDLGFTRLPGEKRKRQGRKSLPVI